MTTKQFGEKALESGGGVLRLAPTWVPRSFCRPGKRIKLHPNDYYALGLSRGAIDERWFASTTHAENGPGTPGDEGLSYVVADECGCQRVLLRDIVEDLQGEIIGASLWEKYHRWPMFSKFFDNLGPLPHHVHHRNEHAHKVGAEGKPEMYYFPAQVNAHPGEFAFTFFGLNPGTTRDELKQALVGFTRGDNGILGLSRAYKLALDTGWDVPPGVLHAPGSLCTYEPQFSSDVYAMYQSVLLHEHAVPEELLWKNCPSDNIGNFDYLVDMLDWEKNVDSDFVKNRFMMPQPCSDRNEMMDAGYLQEWICYRCDEVSAQKLTVFPGRSVVIRDFAAYGFILLEGFGRFGKWDVETPVLIRHGSLTNDEFFVTEPAAKGGVVIQNLSKSQPLVLLKHFSENPDLQKWKKVSSSTVDNN
jgi:hypothetical protein